MTQNLKLALEKYNPPKIILGKTLWSFFPNLLKKKPLLQISKLINNGRYSWSCVRATANSILLKVSTSTDYRVETSSYII